MFVFRRTVRFCSACLALLGLGLAAGCSPAERPATVLETDEPQYRYGRQMEHDGRQDDALAAFHRVIKSRDDDAPESHLESGQIYLNLKNDPVSAIYHFQHFLMARPKADEAPMVAQLIETAKKNFARALPGHPGVYDGADLLDQIVLLRRENEELRKLTGGVSILPVVPANPSRITPLPVPPAATITGARGPVVGTGARVTALSPPRTYTVEAGDTLSSISLKVLGTRGRWTEIFNANRDKLPTAETSLHVGWTLNLPPQ